MKKLKLKNLKLEGNDILKRNELKNVFGGYGGGYNDHDGCMDEAIQDLDNHEAGLGFPVTQEYATEYLNLSYASCRCLRSQPGSVLYDACYN